MRRLLIVFLISPLLTFGQSTSPQVDSARFKYIPKLSLGMELFNYLDNYPTALFFAEYQIGTRWGVFLEAGPVLDAEVSSYEEIDDYSGFKSRTEIKYYSMLNRQTGNRYWFGLDFALQRDNYSDEVWVDFNGFQRLFEGGIERQILASHARIGIQKINEKGTLIISSSIGLGANFYSFEYPNENIDSPGDNITSESALDPLSVNIRVNIGFSIGQRKL